NSDGKLDLAVANYDSNSVSVLLGTGTGSFLAPGSYTLGPGAPPPTSLPLGSVGGGDFNGHGQQDLAVANDPSDSMIVLLGTGTGSFQPAVSYPVGSDPS